MCLHELTFSFGIIYRPRLLRAGRTIKIFKAVPLISKCDGLGIGLEFVVQKIMTCRSTCLAEVSVDQKGAVVDRTLVA